MANSVDISRVRKVCLNTGKLSPVEDETLQSIKVKSSKSSVVYWMSRDQRADDNWALLFAREMANQQGIPVSVIFNLVPKFMDATERQFDFMLKGLEETEKKLKTKKIPFHLLLGNPEETVPDFIKVNEISTLITDFSPLRVPRKWVTNVAAKLEKDVSVFTVDAHNVVPVWITSDKQEYAARTIRPKINKNLSKYLTEFPELEENKNLKKSDLPEPIDWEKANASLEIDRTLKAVTWLQPGAKNALSELELFCTKKLKNFKTLRNKPSEDVLSNMSPYFHFGQIAPQRAILNVKAYAKKNSSCSESADCFVEEALVRRELSENYCFYQKDYDSINGASSWAIDTLNDHKSDEREYVYSLEEFDKAQTHSAFWNAMQTQLIVDGKLHGVSICETSQFLFY